MLRKALLILLAFSLLACSAKPVLVQYQTETANTADWYPIPADAPDVVEVASKDIPRLQTNVVPVASDAESAPLQVQTLTNGLGVTSLLLNREPGAAWELVENALTKLEVPVADKDRRDFRFELAKSQDRDGGFKLFKAGQGVFVVLVPQGVDTLLMIEGEDNQIADLDQANELIEQLATYFGADA